MLKLISGQLFQQAYRIESELGAGGMGIVYLATQLDLNRSVALKILRVERVGQTGEFERFIREFQLLSRLAHPNVVNFYSHGVTADGIPYAICEYINGQTLHSILNEETRLPWPRVVKIALQIADGLGAAHRLGIIHRDLKPGNIMLCEKPEQDTVKIIDFGLARIEKRSELETLTSSGGLIGSVHYMSPEQCRAETLDSRSDIYALGCVLFECISGEKVFEEGAPIAILNRHCNESPRKRLDALKAFAPLELITLIGSMLEKSPSNRPATLMNVIEDLKCLPVTEEGKGAEPSTFELKSAIAERSPNHRQRRKWLVLACFLVMTIAVGFCCKAITSKRIPATSAYVQLKNMTRSPHMRRRFHAMETEKYDSTRNRVKAYRAWLDKYGKDRHVETMEKLQAVSAIFALEGDKVPPAEMEKWFPVVRSIDTNDPQGRFLLSNLTLKKASIDRRNGQPQLADKELDEAARIYEKNCELGKVDIGQIPECASALASNGQYRRALTLLKPILTLESQTPEDLELAGDLCLMLDDISEAVKYYEKSFSEELSPNLASLRPLILNGDKFSEGLVLGQKSQSRDALGTKCSELLDKLFFLTPKRAREQMPKTVALCCKESDQGLKFSNDHWFMMADLAKKMTLKELSEICISRNITLFKEEMTESHAPEYLLNCGISCANLLATSGKIAEAQRIYEQSCASYGKSAQYNEQLLLTKKLDFTRTCLRLNNKSKYALSTLLQCQEQISKLPHDQIWANTIALMAYLVDLAEKSPKSHYDRAVELCLHDKSTKNWVSACDSLIDGGKYEAVDKILQTKLADPEQQDTIYKLKMHLADRELERGHKISAGKLYREVCEFFGRKGANFHDRKNELIMIKLRMIAYSG